MMIKRDKMGRFVSTKKQPAKKAIKKTIVAAKKPTVKKAASAKTATKTTSKKTAAKKTVKKTASK